MNAFSLSLRMLRRDLRAGELGLLLIALVIAVTSLTSVGFFTDRAAQALTLEANQLLGGDLVVVSDHPLNPVFRDEAGRRGLKSVVSSTFTSMASFGEGAQLAGVKVVEGGHPLRGAIRIAPGHNQPDTPAKGIPAPDELWLDERLASALGARPGGMIGLGASRLRMVAVLSFESDQGANFFSLLPRLVMNAADLPATSLIQPGSRIAYRLLLAGEGPAVSAFRSQDEKTLERGERIEDAQNARPEIRAALERAQKFLGLSALWTVVRAAVAAARASRRYMQRHPDPCAVMRCLGATQGFLLKVYLCQFALLGLLSAVLGCVIGYLAHFVLHAWLAQLLTTPLPQPGLMPALQGSVIGVILVSPRDI